MSVYGVNAIVLGLFFMLPVAGYILIQAATGVEIIKELIQKKGGK